MGEVEGMPPYPQDDSSDTKVSSDQGLSQSAIHFPAPKVFHCTLNVNAPLGEGTHELHLFTLEVLLRAGFGEYTQNDTDGEEGCQERASLRGEGLRMKEKTHDVQGNLVKNGQSPFFSVRLPEGGPSLFGLLSGFLGSPLSGLEEDTLFTPSQ